MSEPYDGVFFRSCARSLRFPYPRLQACEKRLRALGGFVPLFQPLR